MCPDCQAFYQRLAEYSGIGQQVTDPIKTWYFNP